MIQLGRLLMVFGVLACFGTVNVTSPAFAGSKLFDFFWSDAHWKGESFRSSPRAKITHNALLADDSWNPQEWVDAKGSVHDVMKGFEDAEIIISQYMDGEMPVLEVGPRFTSLSDEEKRRIAAFVDYGFDATSRASTGAFEIRLIKKTDPIAVYTNGNLQIY